MEHKVGIANVFDFDGKLKFDTIFECVIVKNKQTNTNM